MNYIPGLDASRWVLDVPTYARVAVRGAGPGVDVFYYGRDGALEYDLLVAPGTDPEGVRLRLTGGDRLRLDDGGNLAVDTPAGPLWHTAPIAYQEREGQRESVAASYVLTGPEEVGFRLGTFDPTRPVVLDPVLSYSTYVGGSNVDLGNGIAADASGNAYMTGHTESFDFPTTAGPHQPSSAGNWDVFVTKLTPDGTPVYSTYLGGSGADAGSAIAADASGNAYVTGTTQSSDFPTSGGAFQTAPASSVDAFVTKLGPTGTLSYSTYLGGGLNDQGRGIAVDGFGSAYVTGFTAAGFPTTPNVFQPAPGGDEDAFVTKLDAAGTALAYSSYLGGSGVDRGSAVAVDATGSAYVTGFTFGGFPTTPGAFQGSAQGVDAFVTQLNPQGGAGYSTLLSGNDYDEGMGISADGSGNAYVTGLTYSTTFPTTTGAHQTSLGGAQDAFVTKVVSGGSALGYSTYVGGSDGDAGSGIAVRGSEAWVAGFSGSGNLPTTADAFQPGFGGGFVDAFVMRFNATGSGILYSTYLGGNSDERGTGVAVDAGGNAYVTGFTYSSDFPTTPTAFQTGPSGVPDAFVAKLAQSSTTTTTSTTTTSTSTTTTSTTTTTTSTTTTSTTRPTTTTTPESVICRLLRALARIPGVGNFLRPLLPLFGCGAVS